MLTSHTVVSSRRLKMPHLHEALPIRAGECRICVRDTTETHRVPITQRKIKLSSRAHTSFRIWSCFAVTIVPSDCVDSVDFSICGDVPPYENDRREASGHNELQPKPPRNDSSVFSRLEVEKCGAEQGLPPSLAVGHNREKKSGSSLL